MVLQDGLDSSDGRWKAVMKEGDFHVRKVWSIPEELSRCIFGAESAFLMRMRFLLILAVLATLYVFLAKRNSKPPGQVVAPVTATAEASPVAAAAPAQTTPASTNVFKRPLDRTHEVLDQARKNQQGNGF